VVDHLLTSVYILNYKFIGVPLFVFVLDILYTTIAFIVKISLTSVLMVVS